MGKASNHRTRSLHVATHLVLLGHPIVSASPDPESGRIIFDFPASAASDFRTYHITKDELLVRCAAGRMQKGAR